MPATRVKIQIFFLKTTFFRPGWLLDQYTEYITYHKDKDFFPKNYICPTLLLNLPTSELITSVAAVEVAVAPKIICDTTYICISIYENICICICIKVFNNITSTPLALELFGATSAVCLIIERCQHFGPLLRSADQDTSYQDKL